MTKGKESALLLCALGMLMTRPSLAQEEAADATPAAEVQADEAAAAPEAPAAEKGRAAPASRLIEEIVVTAQKREENLQDVPISVQAFTPGILDAKGVVNAADLVRVTPGLTVTSQSNYTSTYIRGVGSDAFVLGDPSVANYVDGVYFPLASSNIQNFGSVERIEVLKGPQGTLFGRNAVGGAINVITKKPGLQVPEFSVQTAYEAFDNSGGAAAYRTRAHVSLPLIEDKLALSVSGVFDDADFHIDGRVNTAANDGSTTAVPKSTERGVRAKLLFVPTEWLETGINYSRINATGVGTSYAPNQEPSGLGMTLPKQDPRGSRLDPPREEFNHNTTEVWAANALLKSDWLDVKLLASDQRVDVAYVYDFDGTPLPVASFYVPGLYSDNQSAELQLVSNESSWGSDWLKWTTGVFYFESRQGYQPAFFQVSTVNVASQLDLVNSALSGLGLPLVVPAPGSFLSLVDQFGVLNPNGGALGDINFTGVLGTKSLAFYAQATAAVTDWFSVTLGGRFQNEKRRVIESTSGLANSNGVVLAPINDFRASADPGLTTTTKAFDPKVSFDFRPEVSWLGDSPLFYVSYQTATKASIINVINILPLRPPQAVKEEEMTAYEVGLKTTLFDGLMRFNAAAFRYTIKSPQQQFISFLAGGAVQFENSGEQQQKGFEFDLSTQVFPSVFDNLVVSAGALFLDAKYTDYADASGFEESTGLFKGGNDYTGNQIVKSPDFSGTVGLLQTWAAPGGPLELGLDYYYTSRYFFAPQATPNVEQKAYGLLGARVSYLYEPWNVRVTAFGQNLTKEDYNTGLFQTDFGTMSARAPLASYGLRLNWDF